MDGKGVRLIYDKNNDKWVLTIQMNNKYEYYINFFENRYILPPRYEDFQPLVCINFKL